ncbi:hypothetical protein CASFOL_003558 [Castilleja foliolosa]|uniref:Shikimate kinase n=1 Tax=Castilleja foliolosa TaxID=1961234 RepID=A0ABD3EI22_9LAMI
MEIIQACCSYRIRPSEQYQLHRITTGTNCRSSVSLTSDLSVKPKIPSRSKLISTTRAILDNTPVVTKAVDDDQSVAIKKRASEISPDLKGTSIFLVGLNSSYKSSLGRILADTFRYYYFDSDSLVEEAAGGKSAAVSLIERDEEGYLASETEVLQQLSSMGRLVVCAGNGAVKSSTNLALLRHGISIWVDVPLDVVARELTEDKIQLSAPDTQISGSSLDFVDQLATLYNSGRSGYSTADAIISLQKVASDLGYDELGAVTTEDLCMEVLKEIEKMVRVKKMMEEAARPF